MRVWEVTYPGEGGLSGPSVEWFATKRDAARAAREGDGDFRPTEVPTKKSDLIAFLNREWMP